MLGHTQGDHAQALATGELPQSGQAGVGAHVEEHHVDALLREQGHRIRGRGRRAKHADGRLVREDTG